MHSLETPLAAAAGYRLYDLLWLGCSDSNVSALPVDQFICKVVSH